MENTSGQLLIATTELDDPNFARTVVLLVRQDEQEGAMGLILNRPMDLSVQTVWSNVAKQSIDSQSPVLWGGPVHGPLVVLHTRQEFGDLTILPGVFISTQRSQVEAIVTENLQPFRFFLGYAGWGSDQLVQEISSGSWYPWAASGELVFGEPYGMWKRCCSEVAGDVFASDARLKTIQSVDPRLN